MLLEGHIFSLIIFCIIISSSLGNVFDSEFWSIREVILKNSQTYIYVFQIHLKTVLWTIFLARKFLWHTNIQLYFVLYSFGFHCTYWFTDMAQK